MRKLIYGLVLLVFVQCDNAKKASAISYANLVSDCMSNVEVSQLEKGVVVFEKHLGKVYGNKTGNDNELYKKFLASLGGMSFTRDFFLSKPSRKFIGDFKGTKTFKMLYKLYEEPEYDEIEVTVEKRAGGVEKDAQEIPDFYVLHATGKFYTCLEKKVTDKELKSYITSLQEITDIAPTIKASALLRIFDTLSGDDLKAVKLSIVFDLYYGSFLMFS
jgi:hypothetical protein